VFGIAYTVCMKYLPVENAALPVFLAVGVRAPHERSGSSDLELDTFGGSVAVVCELCKVLLLHLNCSRMEERWKGRRERECLRIVWELCD
jgi:hypothetical protein